MTSKVSLSIGVKYKPFKSKTHSLCSPQHLIKPSGLRSANSVAPCVYKCTFQRGKI